MKNNNFDIVEKGFLCPKCNKILEWEAEECPCGWRDKNNLHRLIDAFEGIEEALKIIAEEVCEDEIEWERGYRGNEQPTKTIPNRTSRNGENISTKKGNRKKS